jgi:hypothetical protein
VARWGLVTLTHQGALIHVSPYFRRPPAQGGGPDAGLTSMMAPLARLIV